MKNAIVVMTALPPSEGHLALIDFADKFMRTRFNNYYQLHVLLNTRSFEPLSSSDRVKALSQHFDTCVEFHVCEDDNVPQNPDEHPDFWKFWTNMIHGQTSVNQFDYLFASDTYGVALSKALGCEFINFDIARVMHDIRGTNIRHNPLAEFNHLASFMRQKFQKRVTIFGPESVGKTTLATKLFVRAYFEVQRVPEWAREYLETIGPEITPEKMLNIVYGQHAMQVCARTNDKVPFIIQDTDLLSTLGYYKLWDKSWPFIVERLFLETKSDVYIVMNDSIKFTADPLRYGGNERESKNAFWINLLQYFKCNYYVVMATNKHEQVYEVEDYLYKLFMKDWKLNKFQRE